MKSKDGKADFVLKPNVIKNTKGQEGQSANPDAKHYWNRDIFTYVTYAETMTDTEDTAQFKTHSMKVGDTVFYSNGFIILEKVTPNPSNERYSFTDNDTAIMAELKVIAKDGRTQKALPVFQLKDNMPRYLMDTVISQGLAVGLVRIIDKEHLGISVKESQKLTPSLH